MRGKIPEGEVRGAITETLDIQVYITEGNKSHSNFITHFGLDEIGLYRSLIWDLVYSFWVHNTTVSVSASISMFTPETQSEMPGL